MSSYSSVSPLWTVRWGLPVALLLLLQACASVPEARDDREGDVRGDLRVVVISDLNSSYGSVTYEPTVSHAVRMIREVWRPDLVLAAGDLIAAQKTTLPDEQVQAMWAAFDSVVAAPLRRAEIPFGFTLGNHDASGYPAHARDRRLAVAHWRQPAHDPGVAFVDSTHYPLYYSFTEGELFVLVWDASYAEGVQDEALTAWVRAQLASEAAQAARHRWVLGHLPLYAVAEGRNRAGEVLAAPDTLRALLERYDVDTYVSGHHHAFYPGRRGALELLYTGALGQGARTLLGSERPPVQTVTVVDFFHDTGTTAYTTFAFDPQAPERLSRLDSATLPPRIESLNGYVVRRDLPD